MYYVHKIGDYENIFRSTDSAWIPKNEENSDYAAYLEWLAEGNKPKPWPPAE